MKFGIEAMAVYVPQLYLSIRDLAEERNIDPDKLEKGLGLNKMAVLDVHEDTATLAANVLLKLMKDFEISPKDISRIYLGTESALDAAKPTVTYAIQLVEKELSESFGEGSFEHVDALDMTFACVGGVDALHNSLDFIRVNPNKKAIVISADYAKYALESTGEYTQGAGAVAMLISSNPQLISIENNWSVSTQSVFDFFKPRRYFDTAIVIEATQSDSNVVEVYSDEPIFDGQYSNECYKTRLKSAYLSFKELIHLETPLYDRWRFLAFHLPYAFQGKRVFSEIYAVENNEETSADNLKKVAKSEDYLKMVHEKIETTQNASSEIGNMYTASIFTALLSALEIALEKKEDLEGQKVGFLTYGSGSKSKVFEGTIEGGWKTAIEKVKLFEILSSRKQIDYATYEALHRKQLKKSVALGRGFALNRIEKENPNLLGARYYKYNK